MDNNRFNGPTAESEAAQLITEAPSVTKEPRRCRLATAVISSVACLLAGALLALTLVPNALRMYVSGGLTDKLTLIDSIIDKNYIDADGINKADLNDAAVWGYVSGLGDPYSTYFDAASYTEVQYSNSGGSHGIGITAVYYEAGGGIYITRVVSNSPAQTAGLKSADIITAVDGNAVTKDNFSESMNNIRGEKGTKVKLSVKRGDQPIDIEIERGDFTTEAVYSRMIGDIGYICITTFNQVTETQFADALEWVVGQNAKGIIFDVRGNTGGLVDVTNRMLDKLLGEGEIGYALYQNDRRERLGWSDKKSVDLPYAVLTDSVTASSAEYFASALRDSADAKLIGTTTFGKAIMQTTYGLGDGSALRVTVAKVFTSSGTDYHLKGLTPDIEVDYTEEQRPHWFLLSDSEEPFIQAAVQSLKG